MRNALGAVVVVLGAWEGLAFLGAAPPVSRAYACARRRYRRRAEVVLAGFLIWQAAHLLHYPGGE